MVDAGHTGGGGSRRSGAPGEPWADSLVALETQLPKHRPTRRQRRIARWTRPAPRRDVRWAIGRFGQILIAVGLLMFGFVGYQLWGTGIEYARAQSAADDAVEQLMAEARQRAGIDDAEAPDIAAGAGTDADSGADVTGAAIVELDPGVLDDPTATVATTAPTTSTTGSAVTAPTTTLPVEWNEVIQDEQWFGYLSIPRIDRQDKIIEGVSREALKKGPGHFPNTPLPGQLGNSAIAGHRTTFGNVFLHLDELEIGDEIIIDTPYGGPNNGPGHFVYRVTGSEIVRPSDVSVLQTVDPDIATLTLVTCHPVRTARDRLIVYAELDLSISDAPGPAVIPENLPPLAELPGDDLSTADTVDATAAGTSSQPGDSSTGALPGADGEDDGEATELFGGGWFQDTAAWPHVALWGGFTALVLLIGYRIAKITRFGLAGIAVGIAPFVVTLYFTYQNINRLLPAAL